jgi:uncharacterized protein YlxW (UPF0749 family)
LFVAASVSSDGSDLRPSGGDVGSLLRDRAERVEEQRRGARELRAEIDRLSAAVPGEGALDSVLEKVESLEPPTGLTPLEGPGIRVTLTDAPRSSKKSEIDPNFLVVHEQDIQAFVNALWAGGAEAVSLQGQRLISTTGIKCVGNTVVLEGVPYSPPYVIEAIGDSFAMNQSLSTSPDTVTYASYADDPDIKLGLDIDIDSSITVKGYAGAVSLRYAQAAS